MQLEKLKSKLHEKQKSKDRHLSISARDFISDVDIKIAKNSGKGCQFFVISMEEIDELIIEILNCTAAVFNGVITFTTSISPISEDAKLALWEEIVDVDISLRRTLSYIGIAIPCDYELERDKNIEFSTTVNSIIGPLLETSKAISKYIRNDDPDITDIAQLTNTILNTLALVVYLRSIFELDDETRKYLEDIKWERLNERSQASPFYNYAHWDVSLEWNERAES